MFFIGNYSYRMKNAVNNSDQQEATISLSPPVKPKEDDVFLPRTDRRSLSVSFSTFFFTRTINRNKR